MARYLDFSLNPKATLLLANCHDRVLRLCEVAALPPGGEHPQQSYSLLEANAALESINIKVGKIRFVGQCLR